MMRKPAVIVGLIMIPLMTISAVIVHLKNGSTATGNDELPTLMSTPQQLDETSHGSSTGGEPESAPTTKSDTEGSTGTNNSKEPTPHPESSDGETDPASSEATSEVMLAETVTDVPSRYSLALLQQQTASLDFPRTASYRTRSRSATAGAANASPRNAHSGSSSNSETVSLADVKNSPIDSLRSEEQSSDPIVEETLDAAPAQSSLAHTSPSQTGESSDSSIALFPSRPQRQEIVEQIAEDAPELVTETGPTPPYIFEETWRKRYAPKPVQVPEPSSLMLLGLGLIGLAIASRKSA